MGVTDFILKCDEENKQLRKDLEYYKNYTKRLREDVKDLKRIVGIRRRRTLIHRFDDEYDREDKLKNPNRDYAYTTPDAEEVYRRYYKQKEVIEEVREHVERCAFNYPPYSLNELATEELLEILDKVKEVK